jgi:ABC-type sugar transport system ATPase subunit
MLRLEKISKKIGGFLLTDIDLSVGKGDYYVLIGESGAGKSMLLEIITGFIQPDSGSISLNDNDLLKIPIQERNIGIVYQKPTLFPHMSVFDNIAYPLRSRGYKKPFINNRVAQLAGDTEISHILNRNIANLSGGETQRVTIARALASNPDILLLDEPLSFLDVQLRKGILSLLRKINQQGQTIIHVTHDYDDALSLSNKISIIEKGSIIQTGTPKEVFHHPTSGFVADFIGIKNFYTGMLLGLTEENRLKIFETSGINIFVSTEEATGSQGFVMVPTEVITISEEQLSSSAVNNFSGLITDMFPVKSGMEIVIDIGIEISARISDHSSEKLFLALGKKVWISFKASAVTFIKT